MARTHYRCEKCGTRGVKLWRPAASFTIDLLCKTCSIIDESKQIDESAAFYAKQGMERHQTDQIGGRVPAVPDPLPHGPAWKLDPNHDFWGYTSVPQSGVDWWQSLP